MKNIQYRPIEKRDYSEVGDLLCQTFGLYHYVSNPEELEILKRQYVYSCLAEATYTCVAVENDHVIGVIMGNAKSDYFLWNHLSAIGATGWYNLKLLRLSRKCRSGIQGYRQLHKVYRAFSQRHKGEFDGVLTLFAVEERCQGLGIGRALLLGLLTYLQSCKTKKIYLYTDSTCNVAFYKHHGFVPLEKEMISILRDGEAFSIDVFLYSYSLQNESFTKGFVKDE